MSTDARGWDLVPCGNDDCTDSPCPVPPVGATVRVTVAQDVREVGTSWPTLPVREGETATVETVDPMGHQVIATLSDGSRVWLSVDDLAPA